ncbi:MAG: metal ABC transporter permease [Eubacteriales bacterium]|nr:metal ABC transporter permease [Eubacteriales bacterium]MDD3881405.1 metal ABC transporter permease [Eubacteriales bacterium]MDD4513092.1 metal ABC transporter permease [Eubacteriales bacterium]
MQTIYGIMDAILPFSFLKYDFMKNAFLAMLLLTPMLALLGTMAVSQKMAFFSDALGHSALAGIGLGILLGSQSDLVSMLVFGVVWALLIGYVKQRGTSSSDTVISVFSSVSIALGLLILSRGGGFAKYSTLLVGDVLSVTPSDILWLLLALAGVAAVWVLLYNRFLLTALNEPLAMSRGVGTKSMDYLFMVIVAIAVMLCIKWVGVLLINALLILPAAAARNVTRSSRSYTFLSVIISVVSGVLGLVLSYSINASAGSAVVLVSAVFYFACLAVRRFRPL